jgi:predicted nucleic acid-binding protein
MIDKVTRGSVVIDNTVLSNFSLANAFYLLRDTLRGSRIITVAVRNESLEDDKVGADVEAAVKERWLEVHELKGAIALAEYYSISKKYSHLFPGTKGKLGDGESASLVYANHHNCVLLTDDNGPKKMAAKINVPVTGSIGVLFLAQNQQLITAEVCDEIFQMMKVNGAFFPKRYNTYFDCIPDLVQKFKNTVISRVES